MISAKSAPPVPSPRRGSIVCVLAAGLALVVLAGGLGAHVIRAGNSGRPVVTESGKTIWGGIYSRKQAQRGENFCADSCVLCHGEDLSGDTPYNPSPQLAGKPFMLWGHNRTRNKLFDFIRTKMPKNDPGSLNSSACIVIVAFLLKSNQVPAGKEDLRQDEDVLRKITFTKERKEPFLSDVGRPFQPRTRVDCSGLLAQRKNSSCSAFHARWDSGGGKGTRNESWKVLVRPNPLWN